MIGSATMNAAPKIQQRPHAADDDHEQQVQDTVRLKASGSQAPGDEAPQRAGNAE
jgi:hypothetical protein